ncbi:uncharacterized protein LOC130816074 [Amaranthus tricolor]|uniref:uncharacterized protein LOC130816074 n=1 Tax=Amaranthus tricolor TaxID=29722 RepID=UPI002584AF33|nr:uncharacterized protein LOC130816074 [Amaranthus tricolor]
MKVVSGVSILIPFLLIIFSSFISQTSSSTSPINHHHHHHGDGIPKVDWGHYTIHSYDKQGRGGRAAAAGGGVSNINGKKAPATRKNHAPWLPNPSFLTTTFLAYLTFTLVLIFQF